jgi:hypothetical protein
MSGMTALNYNRDVLLESFSLTQELLSELISDCLTIPASGPDIIYLWHKKIARLTQDISNFVEISTLITRSLSPRGEPLFVDIKNSHIKLLFIMKAISQAQSKTDHIALQDLIKHELKDNLTQWKIDLIPQLKKLLS